MKRRAGQRVALTEEIIAALPASSKDVWAPDAGVRGLRLRVTKKGAKTWGYVYRSRVTKRVETASLGRWPEVSLIEARTLAAEMRRKVRQAQDPQADRVRARRAGVLTIATIIDAHNAAKAGEVVASTREMYQTARGWLAPLHSRPVVSLKLAEIEDALTKLNDRPSAKWRAQVFLNQVLRWSHARNNTPIPTLTMKRKPLRERDRVLASHEIGALLRALQEERAEIRLAVWLLLVTGQRVGEVLGMTWEELNFGRTDPNSDFRFVPIADWRIPAARRKTHDAHTVPLPPCVVRLILRETGIDEQAALFGKLPSGPITGLSHVSREQWQKRACRRAVDLGAEPFQFRDLRRTAASGMAELGVSDGIVRRVLGHTSGRNTTERVYQRHQRPEERREAIRKWAEHVEGIAVRAGALPMEWDDTPETDAEAAEWSGGGGV